MLTVLTLAAESRRYEQNQAKRQREIIPMTTRGECFFLLQMKYSSQFAPRKAASRWIGSNRRHGLAIFAKYLRFTAYSRRTRLLKRISLQKVNPDDGREAYLTEPISNLR